METIDATALRHGLAQDRRLRAADLQSYRHGLRALWLPREDRAARELGRNPDVADQPVAADPVIRRVGLCQPRVAVEDARAERVPAQPQRTAAHFARLRHGGGRPISDLGRGRRQAWLYAQLPVVLAARLFPFRHAVRD